VGMNNQKGGSHVVDDCCNAEEDLKVSAENDYGEKNQ
jgi:hypothetical protein